MLAIAAAIAPVVLVSAAALVATGISQKHTALGDRVRALAAEMRSEGCSDERRARLMVEIELFAVRARRASAAHRFMYVAIVFFLVMVLLIAMRQLMPGGVWETLSVIAFVAGILAMLVGVGFELAELRLANRTLEIELDEGRKTQR